MSGHKTPGEYQKVKKGGIPTYLRDGREVHVDLLACGHAVQRQGTADYGTRRCPPCSATSSVPVIEPVNPVAVPPAVSITHSLDAMKKSIEVMSAAISELVVKAGKMDERLTQVEDMKTASKEATP